MAMAQGASDRTRRQVLILAALAVAVAAFLAVAAVGHNFFDLQVYYGALRHWARHGGEIYDWLKPNSKYGFTYPPFAAVVFPGDVNASGSATGSFDFVMSGGIVTEGSFTFDAAGSMFVADFSGTIFRIDKAV